MRTHLVTVMLLCLLPHVASGQETRADANSLKEQPIGFWVQQLTDPSPSKVEEAWRALGAAGQSAASAVPALIEMLESSTDRLTANAAVALGAIGLPAISAAPALIQQLDHASQAVRERVAESLGLMGPAAQAAVPALTALLSDTSSDVRVEAVWALGEIGGPEAVNALMRASRDPDPDVQIWAVRSIAKLGPGAAAAVPALADLLEAAGQPIAADAAWALGRVLPRSRPHIIPMRVQVEGEGMALGHDGRGAYVTAVDSVSALSCEALNLWLQRTPRRPCFDPTYRQSSMSTRSSPDGRALTFDLTRPIPGSGARSMGVIRDTTAEIHVFWRHEHGRRIDGIQLLPTSDSTVASERAQFHFEIDGEPYRLQMGSWAAGEFQRNVPIIHGEHTSEARLSRPSGGEWIVHAPAGSRARLWNVKEPSRPVDLGLYEFPFRIRWEALGGR